MFEWRLLHYVIHCLKEGCYTVLYSFWMKVVTLHHIIFQIITKKTITDGSDHHHPVVRPFTCPVVITYSVLLPPTVLCSTVVHHTKQCFAIQCSFNLNIVLVYRVLSPQQCCTIQCSITINSALLYSFLSFQKCCVIHYSINLNSVVLYSVPSPQ